MDHMQKGVSLFLSYTNMNKINSLHHVKENPKLSNFLQFYSSLCTIKIRTRFFALGLLIFIFNALAYP